MEARRDRENNTVDKAVLNLDVSVFRFLISSCFLKGSLIPTLRER